MNGAHEANSGLARGPMGEHREAYRGLTVAERDSEEIEPPQARQGQEKVSRESLI